MRKFIYLLLGVCLINTGHCQTAQLDIIRGGSVEFIFESYNDISSGKTLGTGATGFTNLRAYINHSTVPTIWSLDVRANSATLVADYGGPDLALNEIVMDVYLDGVLNGSYTLTNLDQTIVSVSEDCSAGVTHTITITYKCAVPGGLMGRNSDVFWTDLIFNLHN